MKKHVNSVRKVFGGLLVASSLFLMDLSNASRSFFIEPDSVKIESFVEYFGFPVLVTASRQSSGKSFRLLSMVVSYQDVVITVPENILGEIENPMLGSMRVTYCEMAGHYVEDAGSPVRKTTEAAAAKVCLGVQVPYTASNEEVGNEPLRPYIAIDFYDGTVVGFSLWHYDGVDWVREHQDMDVYQ